MLNRFNWILGNPNLGYSFLKNTLSTPIDVFIRIHTGSYVFKRVHTCSTGSYGFNWLIRVQPVHTCSTGSYGFTGSYVFNGFIRVQRVHTGSTGSYGFNRFIRVQPIHTGSTASYNFKRVHTGRSGGRCDPCQPVQLDTWKSQFGHSFLRNTRSTPVDVFIRIHTG